MCPQAECVQLAGSSSARAVLEVRDLRVSYSSKTSPCVIDGLSFQLHAGEIVGIEGRSGCGKTTTALTILKLLPPHARVSGSVIFEDRDVLSLSQPQLRNLRGNKISIIYQEPTLALHPTLRVGDQIAEVLRAHSSCESRERRNRVQQILEHVRLDPRRYYGLYPHELSGGERHRIALAQACVCRPALVIADEPTAGLDPLLKMDVLDLIENLRNEFDTTFLVISHDRAVTSEFADRIVELSDGRDRGSSPAGLNPPSRIGTVAPASAPMIAVRNLSKWYQRRGLFGNGHAPKHALDSVNLTLAPGFQVALIGPSGCGKSTLARCLSMLEQADDGEIWFEGADLRTLSSRQLRVYRPRLQYISQDPAAALNPSLTALEAVEEPLVIQGIWNQQERSARARQLMQQVGLDPDRAGRSCHEFSGGQKHRIAIARALALEPKLLIFDESLSALDPETQQEILRLLGELKQQLGITQLLISHDLALVSAIADQVVVMQQGRIVDHVPGHKLKMNRGRWSTEHFLRVESEREVVSTEAE